MYIFVCVFACISLVSPSLNGEYKDGWIKRKLNYRHVKRLTVKKYINTVSILCMFSRKRAREAGKWMSLSHWITSTVPTDIINNAAVVVAAAVASCRIYFTFLQNGRRSECVSVFFSTLPTWWFSVCVRPRTWLSHGIFLSYYFLIDPVPYQLDSHFSRIIQTENVIRLRSYYHGRNRIPEEFKERIILTNDF